MSNRTLQSRLGAALLTLIVLAGALPAAVASTPTAAVGAAPHPPAPTVPADRTAVPATPAGARPALSKLPCPSNPPWPQWTDTGDGFTPMPSEQYQTGCGGLLFIGQDEVHMTLLSTVVGSADHWRIPIHFPTNYTQYEAYGGFYIQAVVSGDPTSPWNQSLLEISFVPSNSSGFPSGFSFSSYAAVYSMYNYSTGGACPGTEQSLPWNSTYWCEHSDFANDSGYAFPATIAAGDWMNVSVAGVHKSAPLTFWANDSTHPGASFGLTLNYTTTGTYNFTPAYDTACQNCTLQWGMGEGDGVGIDLCPASSAWGACNSYDAYTWTDAPTLEFGIPEYFASGSYSGDYQFLGFESSSGACSYIAGSSSSTVALCSETQVLGGTGYYPYFTYNGTLLDFGATYNWTTWNLGGPTVQFNAGGTMAPKVPLYIDEVSDSSRGGYLPGGRAFNVTARVQAVGHVVNASLVYQLPGGTWTSVPMAQVNGSSTIGFYNATVPATGANGTVNYWVYAQDRAGEHDLTSSYQVVRGPLPTFPVAVVINPSFCGSLTINGTAYTNGATAPLQPGVYSLSQVGCYPYIDPAWYPSGKLNVLNFGQKLSVRGDGTLKLAYTFNPPTLKLNISVAPPSCAASVDIGVGAYSGGSVASVTWNRSYTLTAQACAGYDFAGYTGTGDVNVTVSPGGATIVVTKNGSLTANFVAATSAFPILFLVAPGGCGGAVDYDGADYENDTSVDAVSSSVPIAAAPCAVDGFLKWATNGGASAPSTASGTLTLTSQATVELVQYYLTIITAETEPTNCGGIVLDGLYNLTNGQSVVVANNSTHTINVWSCPGYSVLGEGVTGGLSLVGNVVSANGSGDVQVSFSQGAPEGFVGFETLPAYCGSIGFNGQTFFDTNWTFVTVGSVYTLSYSTANCAGYGFLKWTTYGQITVVGNSAYVNGSGSITAVFTPLADVFITTSPQGCGAVVIGGQPYPGNATPAFAEGSNLTLGTQACPGFVFSSFVPSPGLNLSYPGRIQINFISTLQAVFVPITYVVTVFVVPSDCGTLFVDAKARFSGLPFSLPGGAYPLVVTPCQGNEISGTTVSAALSYNGTTQTLYVNGSGNISVLISPKPPIVTLELPTSAAAGLAVTFTASVETPIYPYNYTYNWTFGDGTTASTSTNTTFHSYDNPGTYAVQVTVIDPLGRIAVANATIQISSAGNTATLSVTVPVVGAVVFAVALIAGVWWYTNRPPPGSGRREPEASSEYGAPTGGAEALPGPTTDGPGGGSA